MRKWRGVQAWLSTLFPHLLTPQYLLRGNVHQGIKVCVEVLPPEPPDPPPHLRRVVGRADAMEHPRHCTSCPLLVAVGGEEGTHAAPDATLHLWLHAPLILHLHLGQSTITPEVLSQLSPQPVAALLVH